MKRSNRLILLVGVFLAVVAFAGILLIFNQPPTKDGGGVAKTTADVVYTTQNIALGTVVTADMLETKTIAIDQKDPTAFVDTGLVVGKIIRRDVVAGTQLTSTDFSANNGQIGQVAPPQGMRAMTVQVDQVSGAGTVISTGDYVDVVVGITGDHFPVITVNQQDNTIQPVAGLNATSVKVLLQGIQVLGTLLPPPTATQQQQQQPQASGQPNQQQTTSLNGQQEIVMLSVTPQQAEVIKYAQLDGSITLVLRSPKDFRDDAGNPVIPPTDPTSGVILKTLVDQYGVLPPQLVETVLPARVRQ